MEFCTRTYEYLYQYTKPESGYSGGGLPGGEVTFQAHKGTESHQAHGTRWSGRALGFLQPKMLETVS